MEIEEAFVAYLLDQIELTDLIDNRIFPDETPQEIDLLSQTAIIYQTQSDNPIHSLTGQYNLARTTIQFTVYVQTKALARQISNVMQDVLCDYQGFMETIYIQKIELQSRIPNKESNSDGTISLFTEDLDFEFNYERN